MNARGFVLNMILLCISILLGVVVVGAMTNRDYQENSTARYSAYQEGMTARRQAEEQTKRVQAEQWNATLQQWAWPTAAGAILVVFAVQAGRTLRHRETERTKRRALLAFYMARMLPDGAQAQIIRHRGELAILDEGAGEIIPFDVAQVEMHAAGLLVDHQLNT